MKIAGISASLVPSEFANSIQAMKACQALAQLGHDVTLFVPGNQQSAVSGQDLMNHYGLKNPFEVVRSDRFGENHDVVQRSE